MFDADSIENKQPLVLPTQGRLSKLKKIVFNTLSWNWECALHKREHVLLICCSTLTIFYWVLQYFRPKCNRLKLSISWSLLINSSLQELIGPTYIFSITLTFKVRWGRTSIRTDFNTTLWKICLANFVLTSPIQSNRKCLYGTLFLTIQFGCIKIFNFNSDARLNNIKRLFIFS